MLATLDRFDKSVHVSALGLESAQRDSQAWAVRLWEQWRGRQRYQLGEFSDAIATLEGMYRPEAGPPSLGINDASALSALAGSALHAGDRQLMQRCAELAAVTLRDGTPELRRHGAWILAQQAMADGDAARGRTLIASLDVPADEPVLPFCPSTSSTTPRSYGSDSPRGITTSPSARAPSPPSAPSAIRMCTPSAAPPRTPGACSTGTRRH